MNLQFYGEKLQSSDEFEKFQKETPESYLCSVFLEIDQEKGKNSVHFDYFSENSGKIISFQMENGIKIVEMENFSQTKPEKMPEDAEVNFNLLEDLISERMSSEGIKNKVQKIILSLQKVSGKETLIGTVFISGMGLIKVKIDVESWKIVEFEKKSFMDIINVFKRK